MAEHFEAEISDKMVENDTEFDLFDPEEDISIFFEVLDEQLELGEVFGYG